MKDWKHLPLSALTLRNYRTFQKNTQIRFAPLTLLIGPNNAGKSSVIEMLRLIEASGEGNALSHLYFGSAGHDLPTFSDVLSDPSEPSLWIGMQMRPFELTFGGQDPELFDSPIRLRLHDELYFERHYAERDNDGELTIVRVSLRPRWDHVANSDSQLELPLLTFIQFTVEKPPSDEAQRTLKVSLTELATKTKKQNIVNPSTPAPKPFDVYTNWDDLKDGDLTGTVTSEQDNQDIFEETQILSTDSENTPTLEEILAVVNSYGEHDSGLIIHPALLSLAISLINSCLDQEGMQGTVLPEVSQDISITIGEHLLFRSSYFQPPRELSEDLDQLIERLPSELYKILPEEAHGPNVEYLSRTVLPKLIRSILQACRISSASAPAFRAKPEWFFTPQSGDMYTLLRAFHAFVEEDAKIGKSSEWTQDVSKWLVRFGIGDSLQVERIARGAYAPFITRHGRKHALPELGVGVAQLLPLFMRPGITITGHDEEILLVQEPEANLHPDFQARLADLFAEIVKGGRQTIVETHSEYLVRRLQYLVAKGDLDPRLVRFIYISGDPMASERVRHISLDAYGQLSEPFGEGFYDEATNLMMDLFRYGSDN